ncbi:uncharacterized protein JCM10292_002683 [Rhodotorula paludigena]|uniref:uncharacterized protein n=1 Tax=Rhodotorula paludigena TaxID=86838 RepID=UPI00316EB2E5
MRPAPGLVASFKEVLSRTAVTETRGGASKLVRPGLSFQRPFSAPSTHLSAVRNGSSAAHPRSWRASIDSLVASVYNGTFKSIRSGACARRGPYSGERLASRSRPQPTPRLHTTARPSRHGRPGALLRPLSGTPNAGTSHVGLGVARQFSTGGFGTLNNVVANAPLALRAAVDCCEEGLDARKWRAATSEMRRRQRAAGRSERERLAAACRGQHVAQDFPTFFGMPLAAGLDVLSAPVLRHTTLALALDPVLDLTAAPSSHDAASDARILSPSTMALLDGVTSAYDSHTRHLRLVVNRLSTSGLLDPTAGATTEYYSGCTGIRNGHRVLRIEFRDGLVTPSQVRAVLQGGSLASSAQPSHAEDDVPSWATKVRRWRSGRDLAFGEGVWWWLLESSEGHPVCLADGDSRSTSNLSPQLPYSDAVVPPDLCHDTFVFPDPPTSSPSTSSSCSSSAADELLDLDIDLFDAVRYSGVEDSSSARTVGAGLPAGFVGAQSEAQAVSEMWALHTTPAVVWDGEQSSLASSESRANVDVDAVRAFLADVEEEIRVRAEWM